MKFEQWLSETLEKFSQQNIQRKGQFLFNSFYEENKYLADKIAGGEYDPFYRDDKIDLFLAYIYLHWKD